MKFRDFPTSQETASVLKGQGRCCQPSCMRDSRSVFDTRETWNEIWRGDKYRNSQSRWAKVSYKLELFQEWGANLGRLQKVADIGCGAGYFAKRLRSIMGGNILAIDISPVAIEMAERLNSDHGIAYSVGDAAMPWQVPVGLDAVFLIGLLEHVGRPDAVLKHAYDSLKPGGELFIVSSHKLSVFHLEKRLLETFGHWRLGYQKDYNSHELIQLLASQGFNVKRRRISGCIRGGSLLSTFDRFLSHTTGWGRYVFLIAERP
jgi:SAM-dependent methyltransferase